MTLFAHAIELTAGIVHIFEVTAGKDTVAVLFVVFHHVEVYRTV